MTSDPCSSTLGRVLPQLQEAYLSWKTWEKAKDASKAEFFQLADDAVRKRGLAVTTIEMPGADERQARERVERHHAGWTIQELRPKGGVWEAILIEDPSLKPFTFEHEGVKYGRTISRGAVMVDDEWLQQADPELYDKVTYPLPWGERVAFPIELLDTQLIGRLTKYIYHSRPRVSLSAPRALKDEG